MLFLRVPSGPDESGLLSPGKRGLRRSAPSSLTRLGWFSLPAIDQYSSLLRPVGQEEYANYRGCWHVVSRGFLVRYRLASSLLIELYIPKYFFTHAASLHQGFPHCAIFPTAASRRCMRAYTYGAQQ